MPNTLLYSALCIDMWYNTYSVQLNCFKLFWIESCIISNQNNFDIVLSYLSCAHHSFFCHGVAARTCNVKPSTKYNTICVIFMDLSVFRWRFYSFISSISSRTVLVQNVCSVAFQDKQTRANRLEHSISKMSLKGVIYYLSCLWPGSRIHWLF